jgi:hypothetical protein
MPVINFKDFGGALPTVGDRALPDNFAVLSQNTWFYGSEMAGVQPPLNLQSINSITNKVFRIPKGTVGGDPTYPGLVPPPSYLGDSYYMQFTDPDTDIVRGPLVNDQYKRWYWCSPTDGLMFNTYARMIAASPGYKVGVAAPATPPIIASITGGVATTNTTRAYVTTFTNIYGEESGPSLPVLGSGKADAVWNIASIAQPVADPNRPAIQWINLYRTITSASGVATYFFVARFAPPQSIYADDGAVNTDPIIAGNLQLKSGNWTMPPDGLQGLIAMPNGFLISWKGNDVYMSEPYNVHAWPVEYVKASEYPVVGLGVFGTTCIVCTQGYPTAISGITPLNCSFIKNTVMEPCLSRGSIVSTPGGVYYASQNGLMTVTAGGLDNITAKLVTREGWMKNFSPQFLRACRYQNGYLALRATPTFPHSGFFLDLTAVKVALTEFTELDTVLNIHGDVWSGEVLMIESAAPNRVVQQWDAPSVEMWPVLWKSKEFQLPVKKNFGAYSVYWDDARYSNINAATDIIPMGQKVRVRAWCNRVLVYDQQTPVNGEGVRLPSGFKGEIWQFELRSRAPVYAMHVATTMKELRGA